MRICSKCHMKKEFSNFRRQTSRKDGCQSWCKKCASKRDKTYWKKEKNKLRAREYRRTHKEHLSQLRRKRYLNNLPKHKDQQLRRTFGISLDQYNIMLKKQNNKCKICNKEEVGRKLSVDHDHKSGKVRGLLCNHCNRGIGSFYDNPTLLLTAIKYLKSLI